MPLNFDFSSNRTAANSSFVPPATTKEPEAEVVNQTPFDQDERFSLVKAELSFVAIKDKLFEMDKKAKALDVKDDGTNTTAMEMLVQCRALVKVTDKAKEGIPAYIAAAKFKSGMDTFIREGIKKPIERIERLINPKVGSYQKAQAELKRRIAQKEAKEEADRVAKTAKEANEKAKKELEKKTKEAEELQKKLNKEADKAGVLRVQVNMPEIEIPEVVAPSGVAPIVKQTEKVKTGQGTSTIKSSWVCVVEDPFKVPRKYCVPDQKLLDVATEGGTREIPGCRIEEKFEAKVRISSKRD